MANEKENQEEVEEDQQEDSGEDQSPSDKNQDGSPNTVEVDADQLETLINKAQKVDDLEDKIEAVADKRRLNTYKDRHEDEDALIKKVNVRQYNNRFVLGWETIKDEVNLKDDVIHEEQIVRIYLEPDEEEDEMIKEKMPLRQFARNYELVEANVIEQAEKADGSTILTVQFENGKELEIDQNFIN